MALRADPPDFIQSGSYSVTDLDGLASGLASTAVGTALFATAVGGGIMLSRRLRGEIESRTGVDTGSDGGTITIH